MVEHIARVRWEAHGKVLSTFVSRVREQVSYADCFLSCKDGTPIPAHMAVLSMASPFFSAIFKSYPPSALNPILVLADVDVNQMENLLQYIYKGSVIINWHELPALCRTAKDLRIKDFPSLEIVAPKSSNFEMVSPQDAKNLDTAQLERSKSVRPYQVDSEDSTRWYHQKKIKLTENHIKSFDFNNKVVRDSPSSKSQSSLRQVTNRELDEREKEFKSRETHLKEQEASSATDEKICARPAGNTPSTHTHNLLVSPSEMKTEEYDSDEPVEVCKYSDEEEDIAAKETPAPVGATTGERGPGAVEQQLQDVSADMQVSKNVHARTPTSVSTCSPSDVSVAASARPDDFKKRHIPIVPMNSSPFKYGSHSVSPRPVYSLQTPVSSRPNSAPTQSTLASGPFDMQLKYSPSDAFSGSFNATRPKNADRVSYEIDVNYVRKMDAMKSSKFDDHSLKHDDLVTNEIDVTNLGLRPKSPREKRFRRVWNGQTTSILETSLINKMSPTSLQRIVPGINGFSRKNYVVESNNPYKPIHDLESGSSVNEAIRSTVPPRSGPPALLSLLSSPVTIGLKKSESDWMTSSMVARSSAVGAVPVPSADLYNSPHFKATASQQHGAYLSPTSFTSKCRSTSEDQTTQKCFSSIGEIGPHKIIGKDYFMGKSNSFERIPDTFQRSNGQDRLSEEFKATRPGISNTSCESLQKLSGNTSSVPVTISEMSSPKHEYCHDPNGTPQTLKQQLYGQNIENNSPGDPLLTKISTAKRRRVRGPKSWEYLLRLLRDPSTNPSLIRWENESEGIFRLVKPDAIALRWGKRTGKHFTDMLSYENFARGLRYHYVTGALTAVSERCFVYKFGPKAQKALNGTENVSDVAVVN